MMFSVPVFIKVLTLTVIVELLLLCLMTARNHQWMPLRIVCSVVATVCIAGLAAVLLG